jgi:predicted ATP-grasp superfamily ATP-dependent carboligase
MDVLILGASPNSLSAARSLGRAGLRVVMAETKIDESVARSRYVARFELLADGDDAVITARLMELCGQHEKPFLLPTGDRYALLVARYQEQLQEKYCFVIPAYDTLEGIVDKARLYETARRHGIPHPGFVIVTGNDDIDVAIANVPTPCYVKPALAHEWRRFKGTKLERAGTAQELRQVLQTFVEKKLVAVPQEIIPGSDSEVFSVAAYIDRSGKCLGWRTKRKLRQWPVSAGDASLQETCDYPEVAALGLRLLSVTGHLGPATVEFRRDERDGRLVLMEINARTILGQEMVTRSGLDVPLMAYHDAKGKQVPLPGPVKPVRWIHFQADFRAFRVLRRRGQLTAWHWLNSIIACRAFAYFAFDDPKPFFREVRRWLVRVMSVARPGLQA